jgi:[methyl-Co(III) methanol-specific corrinoid protein]:coenzyme M methyltransferase
MTTRAQILALLHGERLASPPVFSGLVSITEAGMQGQGINLQESHLSGAKMARLAASTFNLSGFPSAAVPFDLCVEAQALGAIVDFGEPGSFDFPRVNRPAYKDLEALHAALRRDDGNQRIQEMGRVAVICDALTRIKADIGDQAAISGILAGPFTVLSLLLDSPVLFAALKQQTGLVLEVLSLLSGFLVRLSMAYRSAGADFLTVHEMGGSPAFLGPRRFEQLVFPSLKELASHLPAPKVFAVCGRLDGTHHLLGELGEVFISVDQSNVLRAMRTELPAASLFGNIDPVGTLAFGSPDQVRTARQLAMQSGADAIWPGCDLHLMTPVANLGALLD